MILLNKLIEEIEISLGLLSLIIWKNGTTSTLPSKQLVLELELTKIIKEINSNFDLETLDELQTEESEFWNAFIENQILLDYC
mmetsp:Transcript_20894/g.23243  ORF Transcript_20894/g.23243 Transcript_20894/m.23243 type:complete len:83 (+) Transcript_20894:170-418(+)